MHVTDRKDINKFRFQISNSDCKKIKSIILTLKIMNTRIKQNEI